MIQSIKRSFFRVGVAASAGLAALALVLLGGGTANAQMSTTTLGTSIDSINETTYDYFQVLLAKYWPFIVGFGVLLIVWGFGKRIIAHFR